MGKECVIEKNLLPEESRLTKKTIALSFEHILEEKISRTRRMCY